MNAIDVAVVAGGFALIGCLLWFFFGPKTGKAAVFQAGVQEATIRVEGAYQPNRITLKAGVPARLKFDHREATDCSNRVVLPDFRISRALPAFATTTIEFTPHEPGEYPFACAMNMYRGTIGVEPADGAVPDGTREQRLRLGEVLRDSGFVSTGQLGQSLHVNVLVTQFKRLIRQAGLPDLRFHDLRHTSATLLLAQGVHPKIVQERLGHADIAMTLNRYSHVTPDMQRSAADTLDAAFTMVS